MRNAAAGELAGRLIPASTFACGYVNPDAPCHAGRAGILRRPTAGPLDGKLITSVGLATIGGMLSENGAWGPPAK
jgi:hypothetical protein